MAERIHRFVSVSYGTVENALVAKAESFIFSMGTSVGTPTGRLLECLPSYRISEWMLEVGIATILDELEEAGIPRDPRIQDPVSDVVKLMLLENADRIERLLRKRTMKLIHLLPVPTIERDPNPDWPELCSLEAIKHLPTPWLEVWLTFYMDDQWQYCEPPNDAVWPSMKRALLADCIGLDRLPNL